MASISELHQTLLDADRPLSVIQLLDKHPGLVKRTAQRWLGQLVADNRVTIIGNGRARQYQAIPSSKRLFSKPDQQESNRFPGYIPIASDSKDILAYINQDVAQRKRVGYQRDFLNAYKPNISRYLSEPLQKQLHRMGALKRIAMADEFLWVADSTLYDRGKLQASLIKWLTRIPETKTHAQMLVSLHDSDIP
jgi:hypothetical protein